MKQPVMLFLGAVVMLAAGVAGGIWLAVGADGFEQALSETVARLRSSPPSIAAEIPPSVPVETQPPDVPSSRGRILYYRNPMGLPDISYQPKKDWMGMDYIPVYEGEEQDGSTVAVPLGKIQHTGVRSEPALLQRIALPVRAPGTIQLDERRVAVISLRVESFIEKVENVTTGAEVKNGEPLLQLYSPEIVSVAAEYVAQLLLPVDAGLYNAQQGSLQRLVNLGVPQSVISELERTRKVPLVFTLSAPRDGIVLERNVVDGMRAMPGDELFRIADHSKVWALVDVAERDLATVQSGQPVTVTVRSYPGRVFEGRVALVYPHLNPETRTVRVRIELDNHDFALKPDMYVEAQIITGDEAPVLTVPESAVIDSGDRQIVFVDKGEGRFEPRAVQLGRSGDGLVEIRVGLSEGEAVVTSGNFLIDAESNLKAALSGFEARGPVP